MENGYYQTENVIETVFLKYTYLLKHTSFSRCLAFVVNDGMQYPTSSVVSLVLVTTKQGQEGRLHALVVT